MIEKDIINIAYHDGATIEQIERRNFSHGELCQIAAKCYEWAHLHTGSYFKYMDRAEKILMLSEKYREDVAARKQHVTELPN